jgi:hypothetical protein
MSKLTSAVGKILKGISSSSNASGSGLADNVIQQISSGAVALTNVNITGGVLDSVIIGENSPGPTFSTTITSGAPGTGYDVIFYGDTLGEYATWNATLGMWIVSGDMNVLGITDLGNIRISGNTISTTNTNGSIIIDPNGTGGVSLNGSFIQSTNSGNVSLATTTGTFSASSFGNASLTSTTGEVNLISNNGDVNIGSGSNKTIGSITFIDLGTSPVVTTSLQHNLEVGDSLKFQSTNSTPIIDGNYTVTQVVDSTHFQITPGFPVTVAGSSGTFTKNTDIYLTASQNINIPYDVRLTFGVDTNYIMETSFPLDEMNIVSGSDINITPAPGADINIPNNIGITLGSDTRKIESNGTDVTLSTGSGGLILTGNSLNVNSTNVAFTDPIVKLSNTTLVADDNKDRGIEFNYYDTSAKSAWFGYDNSQDVFSYLVDTTNTGEVISGTLGNVKFGGGSFTSVSTSTLSAASIDVCNLNCNGLMTLTGLGGIKLNAPSGQTIVIPQGTILRFGETGSPVTSIYKEASGVDLVIQSEGHVFVTPGSSSYDVILPTNSALVLNGEGGSQKIESISATEMSINSSSFLNLNQISGGVRLTEGLPLLFNQDETSKITGDSSGNLIVGAGNSINLVPNSGQITIPVAKKIELGSPLNFIGTSSADNVVITSHGTTVSSSVGNQTISSSAGDINLTPLNSVILPVNTSLQLGNSTETLKSNGSGSLFLNSNSGITVTSVADTTLNNANLQLNPSGYVNIPYTKPLRFGSASESITGTSGAVSITAAQTNISGNLVVNGSTTTLNSSTVTMDDVILTLGDNSPSVLSTTDFGIEYKYYTTSSKLGYFGKDTTDGYFMYVPDATNTGEVISGALGNAKFATGSFTGVNLNGGNITAVNTISSNGALTLDPGTGADIVMNVDSGANISIPPNVDLQFNGSDTNKIYSDGTVLHLVGSTGGISLDSNTTVNGDLTVTGSVNVVGGNTVNLTVDRFSVAGGGSGSPNNSSNVSFITVSSSGVASGNLPAAAFDGFLKQICIVSLASGATYELLFPTGRLLDPGTGTTVAKKMLFDTAGQAVQLVWDHTSQFYILTQGGGELVLA